jgi:hypothetical protein
MFLFLWAVNIYPSHEKLQSPVHLKYHFTLETATRIIVFTLEAIEHVKMYYLHFCWKRNAVIMQSDMTATSYAITDERFLDHLLRKILWREHGTELQKFKILWNDTFVNNDFFNQTELHYIRASRFHTYWNYLILEPQYFRKSRTFCN